MRQIKGMRVGLIIGTAAGDYGFSRACHGRVTRAIRGSF